VAFIFVSPLLGFVLGSLMMVLVAWIFRRTRPAVDRWFRRLQLVSAGAYSLGHGGNDAQKTIGIIWMLLIATGYSSARRRAAAGSSWLLPGHRHGHHVRRLAHRQDHGPEDHQAQAGGRLLRRNRRRLTLFIATALGIPVSTTHTITGAIVGVGSTQRASAVRWGVAGNIVWAWILTIPASAFVAAIAYWVSCSCSDG
jgi:PiT family inorganic phosphate transporter